MEAEGLFWRMSVRFCSFCLSGAASGRFSALAREAGFGPLPMSLSFGMSLIVDNSAIARRPDACRQLSSHCHFHFCACSCVASRSKLGVRACYELSHGRESS